VDILDYSEISSFLQKNGVNPISSHLDKDFFPHLDFCSVFPYIFSSAVRRNDGTCGNVYMGHRCSEWVVRTTGSEMSFGPEIEAKKLGQGKEGRKHFYVFA